jgi:hypothetical protein
MKSLSAAVVRAVEALREQRHPDKEGRRDKGGRAQFVSPGAPAEKLRANGGGRGRQTKGETVNKGSVATVSRSLFPLASLPARRPLVTFLTRLWPTQFYQLYLAELAYPGMGVSGVGLPSPSVTYLKERDAVLDGRILELGLAQCYLD